MVVVRAAAHFLFQVVVGLILTAIVAAIWAATGGSDFAHTFHISLYVFGALALMMGAFGVGGVSPSQGFFGGDRFSGRIPGIKASAYASPDGTAVNATAILLFTGATLIAIAILV